MTVDIETSNQGIEFEELGGAQLMHIESIEPVLNADVVCRQVRKTGFSIAAQQIGVGVKDITARSRRVWIGW